jgi:hypothetical protein
MGKTIELVAPQENHGFSSNDADDKEFERY